MNRILDDELFQGLLSEAELNVRKRSHFNLHEGPKDSVQRLCIALKSGTYVRPHYHPEKNKWEMTLVLKGEVGILLFDYTGVVTKRMELSLTASIRGVEIGPKTWHTTFPLSEEAVIMEIKEGPFIPIEPGSYATWAPVEGGNEALKFLDWVKGAVPGDSYK
jgi:cupin fold WbuC family metalloprotein